MDHLQFNQRKNRAGIQQWVLNAGSAPPGDGRVAAVPAQFVCHLACLSDSLAAKIKQNRCLSITLVFAASFRDIGRRVIHLGRVRRPEKSGLPQSQTVAND